MIINFENNIFSKKFKKAISKIFENIPHCYDAKTCSKHGITNKQYPGIDIEKLSSQEAIFLYYRDNWATQFYDKINSDDIDEKVFETTIDLSTKMAHILLQRALRSTGNFVKEDGVFGKITLTAVNLADEKALLAAYRSEIAGYYRQCCSLSKQNTESCLKLAYS